MTRAYADASLAELASLVDTADGAVTERAFQDVKNINPATFIGSGKVDEIKLLVGEKGVETVVFDDELTPVQNQNLNTAFGVKVLDRTALILDIFAKRARTKEGKLQVELAQQEYRLPRLKGIGGSLSQQAGYIGTKGPGETKLEVDRRRVRDRTLRLKKEISKVRTHREIHRRKREGVPIPTVSIIGYTNAGKSTLLNGLTGADVFVEDKLFATLDPTVRRLRLKSGREILLADTVGFIRRLPHQLVDSFKATFEEVERSNLLLHVIDVAAEDAPHQAATVVGVLSELGLADKPVVRVFNKCDIPARYIRNEGDAIEISARKGTGLEMLLRRVDEILLKSFRTVKLHIPYSESKILNDLYRHGNVRKVDRKATHIIVTVDLNEKLMGRYGKFS